MLKGTPFCDARSRLFPLRSNEGAAGLKAVIARVANSHQPWVNSRQPWKLDYKSDVREARIVNPHQPGCFVTSTCQDVRENL